MRYAQALLGTHSRLGHGLEMLLAPGLSDEEMDITYDRWRSSMHPDYAAPRFPGRLPHLVRPLFRWRNGCAKDSSASIGQRWLVWGYYPLSLDEALASWDVVSEAIEDSQSYGNHHVIFLGSSFFPILEDGSGNMLVVDVGGGTTGGSVGVFTNNSMGDVRGLYASMSRLFQAHHACAKSGLYRLDEHGFLDWDWAKAQAVLGAYQSQDAIRPVTG